jgi:hypothetical protein
MCCGRSRRSGRQIRIIGKRPNTIEQQAIDAQEEDRRAREARDAKDVKLRKIKK